MFKMHSSRSEKGDLFGISEIWLTTFSFLEIDGDSFSGSKMPICAQNLGVIPFNQDSGTGVWQ